MCECRKYLIRSQKSLVLFCFAQRLTSRNLWDSQLFPEIFVREGWKSTYMSYHGWLKWMTKISYDLLRFLLCKHDCFSYRRGYSLFLRIRLRRVALTTSKFSLVSLCDDCFLCRKSVVSLRKWYQIHMS